MVLSVRWVMREKGIEAEGRGTRRIRKWGKGEEKEGKGNKDGWGRDKEGEDNERALGMWKGERKVRMREKRE